MLSLPWGFPLLSLDLTGGVPAVLPPSTSVAAAPGASSCPPGMMEDDSYKGEVHSPAILWTGPAPLLPLGMAHEGSLCPLVLWPGGDRGPELRGTQAPRASAWSREGWEQTSQTSPVSRHRRKQKMPGGELDSGAGQSERKLWTQPGSASTQGPQTRIPSPEWGGSHPELVRDGAGLGQAETELCGDPASTSF